MLVNRRWGDWVENVLGFLGVRSNECLDQGMWFACGRAYRVYLHGLALAPFVIGPTGKPLDWRLREGVDYY